MPVNLLMPFLSNIFDFLVDNSSWHTISYEEVSSYSVHNSYITDLYRPALSSTQVQSKNIRRLSIDDHII